MSPRQSTKAWGRETEPRSVKPLLPLESATFTLGGVVEEPRVRQKRSAYPSPSKSPEPTRIPVRPHHELAQVDGAANVLPALLVRATAAVPVKSLQKTSAFPSPLKSPGFAGVTSGLAALVRSGA